MRKDYFKFLGDLNEDEIPDWFRRMLKLPFSHSRVDNIGELTEIEDMADFLKTFSNHFDTLMLSTSYRIPVEVKDGHKWGYASLWSGIPIIEEHSIMPRPLELKHRYSEKSNSDMFLLEGSGDLNLINDLLVEGRQPSIVYGFPMYKLEMYKIK